MFHSVLIANRGEIAVRVIRTLHRLGIRSVAVYSDADADARHVREAGTAVRIGPAAAADSYLAIDRIIAAAMDSQADAIHPGYGFLAENAAFARAVAAAGLVFIGPSADAIDLMGDKIRAKRTVEAAGVPVVPGVSGGGLAAAARAMGMPVLLKPSAGGGGKGMRLVREEHLLEEEIEAARRTALTAFADDTLLAERWIDRPRHIEIQVLADDHGDVVHLGERECSLQRRHQKIIEEAPSPLLDAATRAAMGEAAINAARSCGYRGAGTVEFILPGDDPAAYYFMEMNTRLQVEHPVTELAVTVDGRPGLDLVEWQLRLAAGEALPFAQSSVALSGHAIEARVCAETARLAPDGVDFLPSAGTIRFLSEAGPRDGGTSGGVRVDSGLTTGTVVGTTYDPMLAKVIAHASDRPAALRLLRSALARTTILGVDTNTAFLRALLDDPDVRSGEIDTTLVDRVAAGLIPEKVPDEVYATAALLRQTALEPAMGGGWTNPFSVPSGWRLGAEPAWTPHLLRAPGHEPVTVRVRGLAKDAQVCVGDGPAMPARLTPPDQYGRVLLDYGGGTRSFAAVLSGADCWLGREGAAWHLREHDPLAGPDTRVAAGADALTAPMPGTVTVVKAAVGDTVAAGQSLLVVEAMKMEHVIAAPHAGTVTTLDVAAGVSVAMDQVLAVVDPHETGGPADQEPSP